MASRQQFLAQNRPIGRLAALSIYAALIHSDFAKICVARLLPISFNPSPPCSAFFLPNPMQPSNPPKVDDTPLPLQLSRAKRFGLGFGLVCLLLVLSAIVLHLFLHSNGWKQSLGVAPGLPSPEWQELIGLSAIGWIGLTAWIIRLLNALRYHQQLETTLRQTHAHLETWTQERTAQLSATNALLRAEVQRTQETNLALELSESRLQMALAATQTVIWDVNLQTGEAVRSGDVLALFGSDQTEIAETQAAFLERVHPDDRGRTQQTMLDAIAHQTPLYQEYRVIWEDGSTHWLAGRGRVQRDRRDGADHMMGTTINITQQKWLEEELRLAQALSQRIVEATSLSEGLEVVLQHLCAAIAWDFAEAWLPKAGSSSAEEPVLGLSCTCYGGDPRLHDFIKASRALTLPVRVALPGRAWASQRPEWLLNLPEASSEQFVRVELVKDTGLKTALAVPIQVEGQTIAIFLFFSFTPRLQDDRVTQLVNALTDRLSATIQRKRMEEKLQESSALMQTVFSSTPDPIFVKDLQGRYRLVNQAAAEIFGRPAAEILGQNDVDLFVPEIAQALWEVDRRIMATGTTEVVEEQVPWKGEIHYFLATKGVWRNAQGEVIGLVGVGRDITDRVRAREAIRQINQELEQRVRDRTAQLEAANRELETFSYSVSHDLRSPLRSIDGFSQILLTRYHDNLDPGAQHYLQRIRANARRMSELIDDLLQLSSVTLEQMKSQPVNLSVIAQEIVTQLQATQPERTVEWKIAPTASVQGDPRLLRIVLENMLGNAWKYTTQKSIAQIEFGACCCSVLSPAPALAGAQPESTAYFVRDNGAGFNMDYLSKLFIPFQRLHRESEFPGTGVGLATVARIVRRHGGQVGAIGAAGLGATFYFTLPD